MALEISRPRNYGQHWNQMLAETGWWHSFDLPDGTSIRGVNTVAGLKNRIGQFPIPENLNGKRVLDIGCWDGWFSFEMERRGAEVMAIDCWTNPRFAEIHARLNSKVEFREMDVYEINPNSVGRFDFVLFMGVLYHLKHPLLALERVCSVTTEMTAVDSYILAKGADPKAQPMVEFYETDEFEGNIDNWSGPNLAGLLAMCRTAGYARVELKQVLQYSACVACYRKWHPGIVADRPVTELIAAGNDRNQGVNFQSDRDEYVVAYVKTPEKSLALDDVMPQVAAYGVRPIYAKLTGEGSGQVKFKLPPGLEAGWHDVSLRIKNGPWSNTRRIALDIPLPDFTPSVEGIRDTATWDADQLDLSRGGALAIWATLPDNADRHNVRGTLNGESCPVEFVSDPADGAARQVNILVRPDFPTGPADFLLHLGRCQSAPHRVNIARS